MNNLERKRGHIEVALEQQSVRSCFDRVRLKHRALPNVSLNAIHLETDFFGKARSGAIFCELDDWRAFRI